MFCKSCGAEMEDGCKRCTQCGNDPNIDYGHNIKRECSADPIDENKKTKSRVLAGVLQIVFPWAAAGRWYLGNYAVAIAQILVVMFFTIRLPFTFFVIPLGTLWPIYDGICILLGKVKTDAFGNEIK